MKTSSKRILSILGSMALLVGSLMVLTSLIGPAYDKINGIRAEVDAKTETRDQYKDALSKIDQLTQEYQNVLSAQQNIDLILPTKQNVPEVINQLAGLTGVNSLTIQSLSTNVQSLQTLTNSDSAKSVGTLQINLGLNGSYENFLTFLHNLETNIKLMDVAVIGLTPLQSSGKAGVGSQGLGKFSYTITINTYYQGD